MEKFVRGEKVESSLQLELKNRLDKTDYWEIIVKGKYQLPSVASCFLI